MNKIISNININAYPFFINKTIKILSKQQTYHHNRKTSHYLFQNFPVQKRDMLSKHALSLPCLVCEITRKELNISLEWIFLRLVPASSVFSDVLSVAKIENNDVFFFEILVIYRCFIFLHIKVCIHQDSGKRYVLPRKTEVTMLLGKINDYTSEKMWSISSISFLFYFAFLSYNNQFLTKQQKSVRSVMHMNMCYAAIVKEKMYEIKYKMRNY